MRKEKRNNNQLAHSAPICAAVAVAVQLACAALAPIALAQPTDPGPASTPAPAPRSEESDPMAAIEKLFQANSPAAFVYQREGRPDPFFPFLTQQPQRGDASGELSGMQRFDPGQLRLVAIIRTAKGPVAMVQDSAGIGYTLRRGSRIGRNGEVVDILGNKVIIRQEAFSATKEKQYRTTEMVLTKDGDKKP